jgi:hypothetical protein
MSEYQAIGRKGGTDEHQVGVSANGMAVWINLMKPPVSTVISRNPHLLNLIKEIIAQSKLEKKHLAVSCDMQRIVGYADTVVSKDGDTIFYAREPKAQAFTRFVKNRHADQTSVVSMRLEMDGPDRYKVIQVQLGAASPPLPGSAGQTAQSLPYWEKHAVVYNGQALQASSLTKECPYEGATKPASAETATASA